MTNEAQRQDTIRIDCSVRDLTIIKKALGLLIKQVNKSAELEKNMFNEGPFQELKVYVDRMIKCTDSRINERKHEDQIRKLEQLELFHHKSKGGYIQ